MTAALLLGVSRVEAARFSFLLSIPIIAGASLLLVKDAVESSLTLSLADAGLGVAVAFASALLCIRFFLALVERIGMMPFVWYRIALAAGIGLWVVL